MARHPVREAGGRRSHVTAFESIAIGQRPSSREDTLRWLQDHGLIEGSYRTIGRDRFGEMRVVDYSVPAWAHHAWCVWASEQRAKG